MECVRMVFSDNTFVSEKSYVDTKALQNKILPQCLMLKKNVTFAIQRLSFSITKFIHNESLGEIVCQAKLYILSVSFVYLTRNFAYK